MPPSFSPPLYAGLHVAGVRHDALEFSAAGLSMACSVVEDVGLQDLRRGNEFAVTLSVGGAGWQKAYEVVVRVAYRGPAHVGFAFVTLPPAARRLLERGEADRDREATTDGDLPEGVFAMEAGGPAPFAFARLAEPQQSPSRRCILPISESVFALTQRRSGDWADVEPPPAKPSPPRVSPNASLALGGHALPPSITLVYSVTLLTLVAALALVLFG